MWLLFLGICATLFLARSFYRLYLHPLRRIPGPKLAAITHGYEFYHDAIRHGMYIWEIEKMHQKYGKQLNENERNIFDKYLRVRSKREKDSKFVGVFGFPYSMIATVGHDLHRFRRALLNNFFSKKSVLELSGLMHEKESILMRRFEKAHRDNAVLHLDDAFAALTADLIAQYSWGVSSGFLDDENFKNDIRQALNEISAFVHVNRFFPILSTILRAVPRWLLARLRPGATAVLDMQDVVAQQSTTEKKASSRKTIFDALNDPSVPLKERSPRRLEDEGLIVVVAGTETTARTLTLAAFYLYQNKPLLQKLREELRPTMPTPTTEASWPQLEQLPYLTPVSMSSYFVLSDPEVFPDPGSFKPERWIRAAEQGQNLQKFLVSFSRGSRICLGMNLAYAELYMTIASFVRRFDMELYETTFDNIRVDRELGIGQPKEGDFAVRAKVTKVIED
ncbi:MAG: hypothetical protein Q9157_001009 [Trypethelium eluteriae]